MRRPYQPNGIQSGLISVHHDDPISAALSIAANRASKIDKLLADGIERCTDMARDNADSLVHDVLEHIANGEMLNHPRHAQELANIAICARDRCYPEAVVA